MTTGVQTYEAAMQAPRLFRSVERLRGALLWLTGFAGAIVFMEPSPYEVTSLLTIVVFAITGLTLRPALMPLIVLLLLYNTGFSLAVVQVSSERRSAVFAPSIAAKKIAVADRYQETATQVIAFGWSATGTIAVA